LKKIVGEMINVSYGGERMIGNMPFSLFLWTPRKRGKKSKSKKTRNFEK